MMEIQVKLSGFLKCKTPTGGKLWLPDGSTIEQALQSLDIAATSVQSCLVNGRFERQRERVLADGDELSVLPPVGGG